MFQPRGNAERYTWNNPLINKHWRTIMGLWSSLNKIVKSSTEVVCGVAELASGTVSIASDVQQMGKITSSTALEVHKVSSEYNKQASLISAEVLAQMRADAATTLKQEMEAAKTPDERKAAFDKFKQIEREIEELTELD